MTTHTFIFTVPTTVQVFGAGTNIYSESNTPELQGKGTLAPSADGKGWDVFFHCGTEFPLDGFAFEREVCIGMVRDHLARIADWLLAGDL